MMKLFYVVEENYVHDTKNLDSRLMNYKIHGAYDSFDEAANYVEDIYKNHNRRNQWTIASCGEDVPVHNIVRGDNCTSTRIYVKTP